jgi:hypothetical protein
MVKIDGIEIIDHKKTFTGSFLIALIAFSTGVLAYHYIFMILPQKPGCVTIAVKDPGGNAIKDAEVEVYLVIIIEPEVVASGKTGRGGKITFCDVFEPNKEYKVKVIKAGEQLWVGTFTTNERSTADVPVIVRE